MPTKNTAAIKLTNRYTCKQMNDIKSRKRLEATNSGKGIKSRIPVVQRVECVRGQ